MNELNILSQIHNNPVQYCCLNGLIAAVVRVRQSLRSFWEVVAEDGKCYIICDAPTFNELFNSREEARRAAGF